jgi:hypothetical protein
VVQSRIKRQNHDGDAVRTRPPTSPLHTNKINTKSEPVATTPSSATSQRHFTPCLWRQKHLDGSILHRISNASRIRMFSWVLTFQHFTALPSALQILPADNLRAYKTRPTTWSAPGDTRNETSGSTVCSLASAPLQFQESPHSKQN